MGMKINKWDRNHHMFEDERESYKSLCGYSNTICNNFQEEGMLWRVLLHLSRLYFHQTSACSNSEREVIYSLNKQNHVCCVYLDLEKVGKITVLDIFKLFPTRFGDGTTHTPNLYRSTRVSHVSMRYFLTTWGFDFSVHLYSNRSTSHLA